MSSIFHFHGNIFDKLCAVLFAVVVNKIWEEIEEKSLFKSGNGA